MPPGSRRPRTYDPARTWGALTAQVDHVRVAVRGLAAERWAAPSGLPGWDVRLLVVHIVRQVAALRMILAEDPAPFGTKVIGLDTWARSTAGIADELDASTRVAAERAATPADVLAALDAEAELLPDLRAAALRADRLTARPFGGMRALDFTVTRLVELVVHSDDLARATGVDVPLDRQALAAVVRLLADALAAKAPGNSVEVRVPPMRPCSASRAPGTPAAPRPMWWRPTP